MPAATTLFKCSSNLFEAPFSVQNYIIVSEFCPNFFLNLWQIKTNTVTDFLATIFFTKVRTCQSSINWARILVLYWYKKKKKKIHALLGRLYCINLAFVEFVKTVQNCFFCKFSIWEAKLIRFSFFQAKTFE